MYTYGPSLVAVAPVAYCKPSGLVTKRSKVLNPVRSSGIV